MKENMKKVVYINGYKGQNSTKAIFLKDKYNATHIVLKDEFNPDEVCEQLSKIAPEVIIASSTGCFVADSCKYANGVFVYLNPLIDLDDLAQLTDTTKLQHLTPKQKKIIVLINEDDELLDYKKAFKKYTDVRSFKQGGHRFKNRDDFIKIVDELLK